VETSRLTRPPVIATADRVDAELAAIYLSLARHWISYARSQRDPRFLNAALKLCATALLAPTPATALARDTVSDAVDALDHLTVPPRPVHSTTDRLHAPRLTGEPSGSGADAGPARITVLSGADSSGLPMFLAVADDTGLPVRAVILHEPALSAVPPDSVYARAWYPGPVKPVPTPGTSSGTGGELRNAHPSRIRTAHGDWAAVIDAVRAARTDLLVLLGMDVVPSHVLDVPRLGTINAHNGALPAYRGMDAVAWAVLAGDPVVCSVHVVTPDVDAGDVLAEMTVPYGACDQAPDLPDDLRRRVKRAQIALLTQTCRKTASMSALPAGRPQAGPARRYHRMHPSLRRLLDVRAATPAQQAHA
jgi:folate-dependent phosphoribosylglycinamide formyltransferase PurN